LVRPCCASETPSCVPGTAWSFLSTSTSALGPGLLDGERFLPQKVEAVGHGFFEISGEAYETTLESGAALGVDA